MPHRRHVSRPTPGRPGLSWPGRAVAAAAGLTTLAALAAGCVASGAAPVAVVEPDRPARLDEVTVQRFEYPTHDEGDPEQNWADLYLPAGDQQVDSIPLAVLLHGSSSENDLGADTFAPLARELASRGMAVYNIEYRHIGTGGGWPTTFRDVASALDHVVEVDKKFPQITTDDEVVVGHGTGGQLAVWGGTRHRLDRDEVGADPEFRPTRVISIAGPLDMTSAAAEGDDRIVTFLGGTPEEVPDRYKSVDPVQNIDPGTPVVAIHGLSDETVSPESSRRYVDAVSEAGGMAKLIELRDQDHASVISGDSRSYSRVLEVIRFVSAARLDETTVG